MTKPFESRSDHSRAPLRASPGAESAREEHGAGQFRGGGGTSRDIATPEGKISIARQTPDPHSLQAEEAPMNSTARPQSSSVVGSAFSTLEFVEVCAKAFGDRYRAAEVSVTGSGPDRAFYALQCPEPMGLRSFALAPCSLYASPGWEGTLQLSTLRGILDQLVGSRIRKFNWKVFFDHQELAAGLSRLPLVSRQESTHLVRLDRDYERIFAGYNANNRNKVRRSRASGLTLRDAVDPETIASYYRVHTGLAEQKGTYEYIYPLSLFLDLARLPFCRIIVAEFEGRVVGGCVFFDDRESIVYWHGASDRAYSNSYPSRLVLDEAVRWGCERGAKFLNLGASAGIASLERFKSEWGARTELNWSFEWRNPFWERLTSAKRFFWRGKRRG